MREMLPASLPPVTVLQLVCAYGATTDPVLHVVLILLIIGVVAAPYLQGPRR